MGLRAPQPTIGRGSAHAIPWVTYAWVALCVGLYAVTWLASSRVEAEAEHELRAAIDYLHAHNYLEPGPVVAARIDTSLLEQKRNNERLSRERRGMPPIPRRVQARQQQELERLVSEAFAGASELPAQRWGFRATELDPATFLTHAFLHTRLLHLLGGVVLFLLLGFQLEGSWGSAVFAGFALGAAVASAGAHAVGNAGLETPLVGTSGVVAALTAAYAIRSAPGWRQPLYGFLLVSSAAFLVLPVHWGAEWSIAGALGGAGLLAQHAGASYWAFGGGAVFGLVAALGIALGSGRSVAGDSRSGAASKFGASPGLARAMDARAAGRIHESYALLEELVRKNPIDPQVLLAMWDVALECGHPAEASDAMLRAIREELKRDDEAAAVEHWLELTNESLGADAEPGLLIRLAVALRKVDQRFAAVSALQQALQRSGEDIEAVVASRVARESRDLDVDTARQAAWRALGSMDLDLEARQGLEELLAEIGSGIDTTPRDLAGRRRAVDVDLGEEAPVDSAFRTASRPAPAEPQAWVDPGLLDDAEPAADPPRAEAISLDIVSRELVAVVAQPLALEDESLLVQLENGSKKRLRFDRIEALAMAAVGGFGDKPVVIIDLVMNWVSAAGGPIKAIRLRSDRFDARTLLCDARSPLDALRALTCEILDGSTAIPLPDAKSAAGMPIASFDDIRSYELTVFGVA